MDENMALTVKKPLNILSLVSEPQFSEPFKVLVMKENTN